jgi:hypothetical protein
VIPGSANARSATTDQPKQKRDHPAWHPRLVAANIDSSNEMQQGRIAKHLIGNRIRLAQLLGDVNLS